jgi:glycine cleavage system protein P-like pyridoxal-binding family
MEGVTWASFGALHPFAPLERSGGTRRIVADLEAWLAEITGYDAVSLQPNAGSQGELSGLLAIAKYHQSRGEGERDICLIPSSAHGTNAASAVMAGHDGLDHQPRCCSVTAASDSLRARCRARAARRSSLRAVASRTARRW